MQNTSRKLVVRVHKIQINIHIFLENSAEPSKNLVYFKGKYKLYTKKKLRSTRIEPGSNDFNITASPTEL